MPKRMEHKLLEELGRAKRVARDGKQWEYKRSHALVESVSQVWEDVDQEQRWEFKRVGMTIERGIFGDLIDEFVMGLSDCYFKRLVSREICRKRLHF